MNKAAIQDLQKHLEANPQIKRIYFNKAGQWLFHKERGDFKTGYDREEVLAEDFAPAGVTVTAPKVETTKPATAKDLIAAIEAATTEEEVNALVGESEKRATVLDAAKAKLDSFAI